MKTDVNIRPLRKGSRYSHDDLLRTAIEYSVSGKISTTSRRTGIPETTIGGWTRSEWWPAVMAEVQAEYDEEIRDGYRRIIAAAMQETLDRLQHGDVRTLVLRRRIKKVRVPISGRDAMLIAAIAFDKLRLLSGAVAESTVSADLQDLASQFANLVAQGGSNRPSNLADHKTRMLSGHASSKA